MGIRDSLVPVHVGIGADDDLVPPEVVQVEQGEVLVVLVLDLHPAAHDFEQVGDDLALKDLEMCIRDRMFTALVDLGLLHPATGEDLAVAFYGPIHLFAQRWLFRGPLSEAGKEAFRQAAYRHVQRFFQERGTDAWQPS